MRDHIIEGRTDLIFEYLEAGNAATATDAHGVPLIRWCAHYGDVSAVRYLLRSGETAAALGDNLDLNGAAFHGHWRLCEFLIEQGADVNRALRATGETPLHAALCKPEDPAADLVVQVLLANAADPNRSTTPGVETGCFMRDCRTRGETPLHRAAAFGSEGTILQLLDAGASIDARDAHGDSPLSWASWHLRPAYILERLCFGDHRVHPLAVERSRHAHVRGRVGGLELGLLGHPRGRGPRAGGRS